MSPTRINLYPHQQEAVNKLRPGSILVGGVGTGKSRTALAYYFTKIGKGQIGEDFQFMKNPVDLYIITTARKRDTLEWDAELQPFLLTTDPKTSFMSTKVVIDSWNNIGKYTDAQNGFFIFDEQRLVGSGAWSRAFLKIAKNNKWILLSATPGDVWSDYIPVFIANGFYKNRTEFINRHVVYSRFSKYPKIERYIGTAVLEHYRKQISVIMEFQKTVEKKKIDILTFYDRDLMDKVIKDRWDIFKEEPIRDASALCYVMRKISNSSLDRIQKTRELIRKHKRVIIFYNFNYELDLLRELCVEQKIEIAEWNGQKHLSIPETNRWVYLVQYTAGAEGWNCIKTNVIIFYSLNYSYKIMAQAAGRIDRMNTPYSELIYYYLKNDSKIDKAISQAISKKKNFNEKLFDEDVRKKNTCYNREEEK